MSETMAFTTDVMVDLETLSTAPTAAILSIGAVAFELTGDGPIRRISPSGVELESRRYEFYANVMLDSRNSKVDDGTLRWWLGQSEAARARLSTPEPLWPSVAIADFENWLERLGVGDEFRIWGHGANFDIPILEHAFGRRVPWRYNAARDTRTLFHIAGAPWDDWFKEMAHGEEHDALADAHLQVRMVQRAWKMLGAWA